MRIVYKDHFSSFKELLSKDNSVTVHERNLQILATEMYKTLNSLSPKIMKDMVSKIWDFVPKEMKHVTTLNGFKDKIKTWKLNLSVYEELVIDCTFII